MFLILFVYLKNQNKSEVYVMKYNFEQVVQTETYKIGSQKFQYTLKYKTLGCCKKYNMVHSVDILFMYHWTYS